MNPRRLICLVAGLVLWCGLAASLRAQNLQRYVVEARDPSPAVSPHPVLVNDVQLRGGQIYLDVDYPEVGGNLVGTFLDEIEAQELRQQRPDLRVQPDVAIEPAAGGGPVPWSPDRIDQRVGTDMAYLPAVLEACGDRRPFIYVCDTGVLGTHSEFVAAGARLALAGSYIPATLPRTFTAWQDPWDHGTGVAGCAVGETTGAGRCPANLVSAVCYPDPGALPVASFASYAADVIYWSLNEHNLRGLDDDPFNDSSVLVFASSTTTGPSAILDLAVQRAFLGGMSVVVSAGNQNQDVLNTSPAGAVSVMHGDITLTVAASTVLDARWANSNFGANVELFAPGENVLVASSTGPTVCNVVSGTSFSAGYTAGAAARILAKYPWASAPAVMTALTDQSDLTHGPSGPFGGAGVNAVPSLLFVNPDSVVCISISFARWMGFFQVGPGDPEVDLDSDWLTNAFEYAMALDPTVRVEDGERPALSWDGNQLRFHFRRADFLCDPVELEVEYSTDLINWTVVPGASIVEDDEAPCIEFATWMVAPIPGGGGRVYVRLKISGL